MASSLMGNRKKRFTESNKECAPTFTTPDGKTYDDCTLSKTPDKQEAKREWCYIREDQKEENKRDWDTCRPDLNYDKVRSYNQDQVQKFHIKLKQIMAIIMESANYYMTFINLATTIENTFMEIDMNVGNLLQQADHCTTKMNTIIEDYRETSNLENLGVSIGEVLGMKEMSVSRSSFLALEIKEPESGNLDTDSTALVEGSPEERSNQNGTTYQTQGETYGGYQSDSDEVVAKDTESSYMVISPWIQERQLSSTRDGGGMVNYEQDASGDGIIGKYFQNKDFLGSFIVQKDPQIDFDFTDASPAEGINKDNFSIKFTGYLLAPQSCEYQFTVDSDGGVLLNINKQLILSRNMSGNSDDEAPDKLLTNLARSQESTSNTPNSVKSLKVNLIGGNKYKIVLSYMHSHANMINPSGQVYLKLFWECNLMPKKIIEKKYLFSESVFDPMKITDITPDSSVVRKLQNIDLAFKDSKTFILSDIPREYVGLNCLKLNMKYQKSRLKFTLNNPSIVYIAYPESYSDPTPVDFTETNQLFNVNELDIPPKHEWKKKYYKAKASLPYKIKKKPYPAGKIDIPLNKGGENNKSISMVLFFSYDRFNNTPISCGGDEIWISKPDTPYYKGCSASSEDRDNARSCDNGLNGGMNDQEKGGSMWATLNEGEGAWIEVNFNDTFQISRIEFQDRSNANQRNKTIEALFSNGFSMRLNKRNTGDRREYKIDPPQKSHNVKFTIKEVYSTANNGGAFKIHGYKCSKSEPDNDNPETTIGSSFITGLPQPELPALYDLGKTRPVKLTCNDKLDTTKFTPHHIQVGNKILIKCGDSCMNSGDEFKVYGGGKSVGYSEDSVICKAAFHADILKERGGVVYLEIMGESRNLKSSVNKGIKSWPKQYSKYTMRFWKKDIQSEIIMKVGSKVDYKNPNGPGFLPCRIKQINDASENKELILELEHGTPNDTPFHVQLPAKTTLFPCSAKISGRECSGSRIGYNTNRPLKFLFTTLDRVATTGDSLPDYGGEFGTTGKAYGWSIDMSKRIKKRTETNDARMETLVEFFPSKKSLFCMDATNNCDEALFSIKTGPGNFNVKIGIGDPSYNARVDIKVNGSFIVQRTTLSKGEFQIFEGSVPAVNGFLSFKSECLSDCDYQESKMNYIEISPVRNQQDEADRETDIPPETYNACGMAYFNGERCYREDPTNCVYLDTNSPGVHMCSGTVSLVKIPDDYKCTDQRGNVKCVKKYWERDEQSKCNEVCPNACSKNSGKWMCT
eukprot:CAMPEP_0170525054 /NCGR_PEP_ID=MMETSP0209-20121228/10510_1 /TAXON_ID=665100 ORGANISM="Litonotus pictus, Strain P1" /NCGR_SAMPLE_ID=MMETSP0209 /ASSEMBLY_ACC=CAM_ASM_000301 /LENGTH=1255 /DNA_ID=CAMNT_0010814095 /DNA_START=241 /DNA_END=4008 /DNA_ORIENTATION=-